MVKSNQLVLVRHGESEFNLKNLFCGWHDAPLSAGGKLTMLITVIYSYSRVFYFCHEVRNAKMFS